MMLSALECTRLEAKFLKTLDYYNKLWFLNHIILVAFTESSMFYDVELPV